MTTLQRLNVVGDRYQKRAETKTNSEGDGKISCCIKFYLFLIIVGNIVLGVFFFMANFAEPADNKHCLVKGEESKLPLFY